MKKIGITGQSGFVGTHLYNTLGLFPEAYERVSFQDSFFKDQDVLDSFVSNCDVIVHLAGVNRHEDPEVLYQTNIDLAQQIVNSLERTKSKAHVIFSSSLQEAQDNHYGKSKKIAREILANWAKAEYGVYTGMVVPNVFGPFGKPNYNSFIATFCYKLSHGEDPQVLVDNDVELIYVGELVDEILQIIERNETRERYEIKATSFCKVTEILKKLQYFKAQYFDQGIIPNLESELDYQLFNTFRCYFDIDKHYPVKLVQNVDDRGAFVEVIRLGIGGQCSFSTTKPGITRGNHFHTRKIERFAVISGKALIQLRKIGTDEVLDFYLDGNEPAYVDMPIWYTHNIKNIGTEELYTIFWINEPYDPNNADTFFETV